MHLMERADQCENPKNLGAEATYAQGGTGGNAVIHHLRTSGMRLVRVPR